MKPIHIATSPLTNRIFAGHVLKCGTAWAANKQDVTGAACGAVCEHVMANGGTVEITANGRPKFEITVRDLEVGCAQPAPSAPEGGKLVLIEPTPGMMRGAHRLVAAARRVLASADSQGLIRLDESGDVASELRSALEAAPEAKP